MADTEAIRIANQALITAWLALERASGAVVADEVVGAVPFDFASATPLPLFTVPMGGLLNRVAVKVTAAWDGAAASIEVGTVASASLVFAPGEVNLALVDDTFDSDELFPASSAPLVIQMGIVAGAGATTGAGILLYKYKNP